MEIKTYRSRAVGAAAIAFCLFAVALAPAALAQDVPVYKVDPFWPKVPLKNKWLIQGVPTMVRTRTIIFG